MRTWKVTIQSARSKSSYEVSGSGGRRARSRWELLLSITSPVCPVTPRIRKDEPQSKWQKRQPREEEKPVKSSQRGQAATLSRSSLCGLPIHITSSTPGGHSPRTSSLFLNYGNAWPQKPKAPSCPDRPLTAWLTCFSASRPSTHSSTLIGDHVHGARSRPPPRPSSPLLSKTPFSREGRGVSALSRLSAPFLFFKIIYF